MQTLNIVIKVLKTTNIHTFQKNCDIMVLVNCIFLAIYRIFGWVIELFYPYFFPRCPLYNISGQNSLSTSKNVNSNC